MEELKRLLDKLDVPELRKSDLQWLIRNLGIRNSDKPEFQEAYNLIKILLKSKES